MVERRVDSYLVERRGDGWVQEKNGFFSEWDD